MAESNVSYSEPVHQSIFVLGFKIVVLQFIIGLAAVLVSAAIIWSDFSNVGRLTVVSLVAIVLQTFDGALLVYIILDWANTSYLISPEKIIIRQGRLRMQETAYKSESMEIIKVTQSFFGRIFNYGNVSFAEANLKQKVALPNIPNPRYYEDVLRQVKA